MEPRFRRTLEKYSNLARQSEQALEDEKVNIEAEVQEAIADEADKRMMAMQDQEKIYLIQQQKQKVMDWLHDRLREVDEGEQKFEPKARPVKVKDGRLVWARTDGTFTEVTEGMLLTDGIWDVEYALDPQTVPRTLRKKYYIEKARQILQRELDRQIAIDQQKSPLSDIMHRSGYAGLVGNREALDSRGHLAERMVYSFFRKITADHDLPFEIVAANVYEDIQLKIDFIIRIKTRSRAVSVEGDEGIETIGIQFTLAHKRVGKQKKIDRAKEHAKYIGLPIDDIVIVRMPIKQLNETFSSWSLNKPPGGPDELWGDEVKAKLFKQVLKDLFLQEEIDLMWEKINASQNPF
ncbi:MAG: hypothetical protein ACOYUZ_05795 [Patescibacteria group bacterium]